MLQIEKKNSEKIIEDFNWKKVYSNKNLIKNFLKKKKDVIVLSNRSFTILPQFIDQKFKIYNGKLYTKLNITPKLLGYKFGAFSFTRNSFKFKWLKR